MNYHLMVDDKFIDRFIEGAEEVSPGKNIYIYTFSEAGHVKSNKGVRAPYGSEVLKSIIKKIKRSDRLFIHWFTAEVGKIVEELDTEIPIYLFFWGGDFLEQTPAFIRFNYDPLTLKYFHFTERLQSLKFSKSLYNNMAQLKNFIFYRHRRKTFLAKQASARRLFLKRLNYFCHWNEDDLETIKKEYDCAPGFRNFFYSVSFDKISAGIEKGNGKDKVIWLGNSATLTNNHLDALACMESFKNDDVRITVPLSYGPAAYADHISRHGKKIFNERFVGLRNFMPLTDYFNMLKQVDVVVMFHNRTQAAGNICTFIRMGKKVFIKGQSTIYSLMKKNGIVVFDANDIRTMSFAAFIEPISYRDQKNNFEKISGMFSEGRMLSYLNDILN